MVGFWANHLRGGKKEVGRICPRKRSLLYSVSSQIRESGSTSRDNTEEAAEFSPLSQRQVCIALLSPYGGGNFGDAAIQDSMISNLRSRLPNARFSGISLNNHNYITRHGSDAYPLCALRRSFWGMTDSVGAESDLKAASRPRRNRWDAALRSWLHRVPGLPRIARSIESRFDALRTELRHWKGGYRFLKGQNLLVICGGGQLDEEWGGPWGHPYALFKWTLLSSLAGIPCAMASVGACKVRSRLSRFFLAQAVRFSNYRSYRDENSKLIASSLLRRAAKDSVVQDLAFCLPESEIPAPADLKSLANGRKIIAISPIVYGKPGVWPSPDAAVFDRYMSEMTVVVSRLLSLDYFLVFVWSAGSDRCLISEVISRIDDKLKPRLATQTHVPQLQNWKDLVAILRSADALIASRLHSALLGFLAQIPVVAISFDPKVDWAMRDSRQTDALLHIRDFTASGVLDALRALELRGEDVVRELSSSRKLALDFLARQFDTLSQIAIASAKAAR